MDSDYSRYTLDRAMSCGDVTNLILSSREEVHRATRSSEYLGSVTGVEFSCVEFRDPSDYRDFLSIVGSHIKNISFSDCLGSEEIDLLDLPLHDARSLYIRQDLLRGILLDDREQSSIVDLSISGVFDYQLISDSTSLKSLQYLDIFGYCEFLDCRFLKNSRCIKEICLNVTGSVLFDLSEILMPRLNYLTIRNAKLCPDFVGQFSHSALEILRLTRVTGLSKVDDLKLPLAESVELIEVDMPKFPEGLLTSKGLQTLVLPEGMASIPSDIRQFLPNLQRLAVK